MLHGIGKSTKTLLGYILRNIVEHTISCVKALDVENPKTKTFWDLAYKDSIIYLAELLRNYPELSIYVINYKVGDKFEFPSKYPDALPPWKGDETFLQFFLKYVCYFTHFTQVFFLQCLTQNKETPIIIEVNGEL